MFLKQILFTKTFNSRTSTIHPGIFCGRALFKQWSISVEELWADSCASENLMFLKEIFAREAKLSGHIC